MNRLKNTLRGVACGLLVLIGALSAPIANAANTTYAVGNPNVTPYESLTGYAYEIKGPSLAAGTDTLIFTLDVSKAAMGYQSPATGSVPAVCMNVMAISGAGAGADSSRINAAWRLTASGKDFFISSVWNLSANQIVGSTNKTPTQFLLKNWGGFKYMKFWYVNKHATLARTPTIIVSFTRPVFFTIDRAAQ